MGKILFWVVLIVGMMLLTRILSLHNAKNRSDRMANKAAPKRMARSTDPEQMVRCAHCGIHLPRSEAVLTGGQTWCSREHAKQGPRDHPST